MRGKTRGTKVDAWSHMFGGFGYILTGFAAIFVLTLIWGTGLVVRLFQWLAQRRRHPSLLTRLHQQLLRAPLASGGELSPGRRVRLLGRVATVEPSQAPVTDRRCAWYEVCADERIGGRWLPGNRVRGERVVIDIGGAPISVGIDPAATVVDFRRSTTRARSASELPLTLRPADVRVRFRETILRAGDPVAVLGVVEAEEAQATGYREAGRRPAVRAELVTDRKRALRR
jgi:hypothetical protein